MYLWQNSEWPHFSWDEAKLSKLLAQVSREQGRLLGKMEMLGFDLRNETHLRTLTEEVVKSSEIEGEKLETEQVRSSIARRLGMDIGGLIASDRHVEGVVEMTLDATRNAAAPLTQERLFAWHAALFPTGHSGMSQIQVGRWRDDHNGPMQVVSGPIGREKIHYQAPPAERLNDEMNRFLAWFEQPSEQDPLLHAGLAHLWFVTIHPFEDGNGRIARAIADMALTRSEQSKQRFYSMSAQIRRQHQAYYDTLEWTQKGDMQITQWQEWFLNSLLCAIKEAEQSLSHTLRKAHFWERFAKEPLNQRQIKILNKLLEGFEGKLTTSKWAKIAKCSQDTAYRDILDLIKRKALQKEIGGGRNTSYGLSLVQEKQ
ncbi:MAG: Fic family protein [Gammaproteobacteria bacterium]|nr:Fic family protein [Gammaproteobacteria bacterium]